MKAIIYKNIFRFNHSQSGSVAIVVALSMIVLLTMFAFVIDTGYLYGEKNKYQNGVEAAAMAGAVSLCDGDSDWVEGVARQVAVDNGLPAGDLVLVVQVGFYDEKGIHGNFPDYKDFVWEGEESGYPPDEFNNAVMVKLNATEDTLMGGFVGKDEVSVGASAVAYLKRYSMVSLADDGEIRLGNNSRWKNGDIYANGDIKYPESNSNSYGNAYQIPEFTNSAMFAAGEILECPVPTFYRVDWDSGFNSSLPNAFSGQPEIDDIRPMDDAYMNELKASADVVYTANDSFDDIFYGYFPINANNITGDYYHFDLAGNDSLSHITYFFDAGDDEDAKVILNNNPHYFMATHTPNGYTISNVTFIANCPIHIDAKQLQLGGTGNQLVQIISSSDISVPKRGGFISWKGVFLRCGGDFLEDTRATSPGTPNDEFDYMRIIADGDIKTTDSRPHTTGIQLQCDFMFGPPCPPTIPRLGRLELLASD